MPMPTRPGRASLSTSHGTRTIYSKSLSSSSSSSSSLSSSDSSANSSSISACTRPLVRAGAAASASSSERASSSDSSSVFDSTTSFFFAGAFLAAAAFLAPVPFVPFYFVTDTGLLKKRDWPCRMCSTASPPPGAGERIARHAENRALAQPPRARAHAHHARSRHSTCPSPAALQHLNLASSTLYLASTTTS